MSPEIVAQLAPTGVLRAGINLSNFLLVTGRTPEGDPMGVAPDMARAVADRLGVPVRYVPYPRPGELADAAGTNTWDIGLIGAEPQRAEKIAFTTAYAEIEATCLVPAGSSIATLADLDRPGVRRAGDEKLEALAGLRPRLIEDAAAVAGSRILDGRFMAVQQAVGTARANAAAAAWLQGFVEEAKASGLVASLIARHGVQGLSVAPPA